MNSLNITVFTDLHLFAPNEMRAHFDENKTYDQSVIFLGDIFDLANCKKSFVPKLREICKNFIERHQRTFVLGNHERAGTPFKFRYVVVNNTVFTHGDLEANPDKWGAYRKKEHGAGFLKRTFIVPFIEDAEQIIDRKPKEDFLKRASTFAKEMGVTNYVCGHFHPKEMIVTDYDGVRIYILPRGQTVLSV